VVDLEAYLEAICSPLGVPSAEIRTELRQHIEQAREALEAAGHPSGEALQMAISQFGDPEEIARGLAAVHQEGGRAMWRRVFVPAMLSVASWVGTAGVGALLGWTIRGAINSLLAEHPPESSLRWIGPVVPSLDWLVFVVVLLAVRLCARRGGSRAECALVGLAPAVVGALAYGAVLIKLTGLQTFSIALGSLRPVVSGGTTLGSMVTARVYLAELMGLFLRCLAATWLWFLVSTRREDRPFVAAQE
jgi:hypothetical protein